jgi:hypothetical protein
MDYQDFCWLAAKSHKKITTGYVARVNDKAVRSFNDSLAILVEAGNLPAGSVFITTPASLSDFAFAVQSGAASINYLDGYYYLFDLKTAGRKLIDLTNELNKPFSAQLAGAKIKFGPDPQFARSSIDLTPGELQYNIEHLRQKDNWVSLDGWAFEKQTGDNSNDSLFVVLKNDSRNYLAFLPLQARPDVTSHFKRANLDRAGFKARLFTTNAEKGKYQLCIGVLKPGGIYLYTPTENYITVGLKEFADILATDQLPPLGDISYNAETVKEEGGSISIQGWAFIKGQNATNSRISIALQDGAKMYYGVAEMMARPDVHAHFGRKFGLENSGFTIKFKKAALVPGNYQLGVIINDTANKKQLMIKTEKRIVVNGN